MSEAVVVRMATEREAKKATGEVRAKVASIKASWWELGQMVREALERQVPQALEMTAIEWLRETVGESVAKVYRAMRCYRALEGVPEETVKRLTEGNAYQLTRLPEKERKSAEWISRALDTDNGLFEEYVDNFIGEKTGHKPERHVQIKVSVDESVSNIWNEAEAKLARILELDIETKPGLRAQIFEALATLVLTTDAEVLRTEMVGE